jgi:hypothetical protein
VGEDEIFFSKHVKAEVSLAISRIKENDCNQSTTSSSFHQNDVRDMHWIFFDMFFKPGTSMEEARNTANLEGSVINWIRSETTTCRELLTIVCADLQG